LQRRSLYAALLAAIAGAAGVIFAASRRRATPNPETPIQTPVLSPSDAVVIPPSTLQEAVVSSEESEAQKASQPSILTLLVSGLGIAGLIIAQTLLLYSRSPIWPMIFGITGVLMLQPVLAFYAQAPQKKFLFLESQSRIAPIILALSALLLLLNISAPPPFNPQPGEFQMLNALVAVLVIPTVYVIGETYGGSQVGLIAAGLAAVSGWTLALGKAKPEYVLLAIISAVALVALEYIRQRQGNIFYAIWVAFFLGGVVLVARLMAPVALVDPSRQEQIPANPQLSVSEGLFTSLLMFNLTSDPNPLHGMVDRPVFSPILSALFIVGLLALAWRIDAHRRWKDIFLLSALVITLFPSALQFGLPVRYPDIQRAAMALPVALVIAALGASVVTEAVIARLGRVGLFIAIILLLTAMAFIAVDANQHYTNYFLPIYENGVTLILPN